MKRPMSVLGITVFAVCVAFSLCGIQILPLTVILGASVLFLYFIKPLKLRSKIIIPTICVGLIVSSVLCYGFYEVKVKPCLKYDGTITDIQGKVISEPVNIKGKVRFTLDTEYINNGKFKTKIVVSVPEGEENIELYDIVSLYNAEVSVSKNEKNRYDITSFSDGVFLYGNSIEYAVLGESGKTPYYYCIKLKSFVTERISEYLKPDEAGFLNGMLFGDKSQIDDEMLSDFRYSGVAHLLAVSGLHTTLWCGLISGVLGLFIKDKRKIGALCILFLCSFCIISGFTPSVLRASLMMGIVFIAPFFNREQDSFNSLGFAVFIISLLNPYVVISPSFLLSVSATLGILFLNGKSETITNLTKKIKNVHLMKIANYLILSVAISGVAGVFTLPVAVWFFGTFSLLSPITNILCMNLAFYGMISGTVSVALSLIPSTAANTVTITVFKVTEFLLDIVINIISKIADIRFCSIHIFKENLIIAIIICIVIVTVSFVVMKIRYRRVVPIICVILCVCVTVVLFVLPMTKAFGTEVTVHNSDNGMVVTIKSGLEYMHFNFSSQAIGLDYDRMPVSTSEESKLLYIGSTDRETDYLSDVFISEFNPETTVVTSYVKEMWAYNKKEFSENTIIADEHKFKMNEKIEITTVDTYILSCAIIDLYGKKVALLYRGDIETLVESYGTPNMLVTTKTEYSGYDDIGTIVVSSDSDIIFDKKLSEMKRKNENVYVTAENGSVTINLREI